MKIKLALLFIMTGFLTVISANGQEKTVSCDTEELRGIVYKTVDGKDIKLDLFLPVRDGERLTGVPLLIWIDSGGYSSGNPGEDNGGKWRETGGVEKGFAVANVTHRGMNEGNVFPKQIEDVKAAVRFLRAHAAEYNLDPGKFAVMGGSSGGHLATFLGISDKYRLFDVGENLDQSSQVQCVIDVCGTTFMPLAFVNYGIPEVVDTIEKIGGLTVDRTKPIWEQPEAMATCMKYSVVTYVDADYSPTLIVQGALDPAIMPSQSFLFYEMLKKYGVRTELKFVEEGEHNVFLKMTREEMETLFYGFLGW